MGFLHISGNGIDDFFLGIQHHIADKCKFGFARSPNHIFVNGVSIKYSRTRMLISDKFAAMVGQNAFPARYTGKHAFPSSRETGKEMRFDKTFTADQVGIHNNPVDQQVSTTGKYTDMGH